MQFGIGSNDGVDDTRSERLYAEQDLRRVQESRVVRESERTFVSGGLLLGAEIKVVNGVTLGGAYTFGVEYADATGATRFSSLDRTFVGGVLVDEEEVNSSETDNSGDDWRFGVGTTRVALSVYF